MDLNHNQIMLLWQFVLVAGGLALLLIFLIDPNPPGLGGGNGKAKRIRR